MKNYVYSISYDLGKLSCLEAAVSADSHERARDLLKEFLDEKILGEGTSQRIGLRIMDSYASGMKSDREGVIVPSEDSSGLIAELVRVGSLSVH